MLLATAPHFQELHSFRIAFHPLLAEDLQLDWLLIHLSLSIAVVFHCRTPCPHSSWWCFFLTHNFRYILFEVHSHFSNVNFHKRPHTSAVDGKNIPWYFILPEMIAILFYYGGISVSACRFFESDCTPSVDITSPEWYLGAPEMTFIFLFRCKFSQWHAYITFPKVLLWSLQSASYPAIKMSSAIQIHLVDLLIFHQIFPGTSHLLVPLQIVVWWLCTCHWHPKVKMICYQASGCILLSLHQLWSHSTLLLVWGVYHLVLGICVLVLQLPGCILQGIDITILCHWVWGTMIKLLHHLVI